MENGVDALKMAAAALIFITALAVSLSLFATAKQTADSIIGMRNKQAYLEPAELDGGILYTSSDAIMGNEDETDITHENIAGITKKGDRVVDIADVLSTIQRYPKERYGVTIVDGREGSNKGKIIARYDSGTESIMQVYYSITSGLEEYIQKLKFNTTNDYATLKWGTTLTDSKNILEKLYYIKVQDNPNIQCGAPWYGNANEIQKRIIADFSGTEYSYLKQTYNKNFLYVKNLSELLINKKIIEVINEIDQSAYITDEEQPTDLLQQYQMPTVEIIYIFY